VTLPKHWRTLFLGLFALSAFLVIAACGDDDDNASKTPTSAASGTAAPSGSSSADDAAPASEQHLTIQSLEPQFYDPHRSNFEQDISVQRHLFRGLYRLVSSETGGAKVEPAYATADPTVSADGKTFTIKIKSGQKWSDGKPVTAEQFADGVKAGCDPRNASPYTYLLQTVAIGGIVGVVGCDEYSAALGTADAPLTPTDAQLQTLEDAVGAKATDDTTLVITTVDPVSVGTFENIFSLWTTFPARKDLVAQFGEHWVDPANIATNGPFTLTEVVPADHITLKPNPNYAIGTPTKLQELTIQFIDDYSVAERDFKNGELDVTRIPDTSVPTNQGDDTYKDQLLVYGSARITTVEVQMKDPTLAKPKVRLALSQSIDRDQLTQVTTSGVGQPALYWVVKGIDGHQGNEPFQSIIGYDPVKAKQNLADAGYANGAGFPAMSLLIQDTPNRRAQADFLKAAWKDTLNIDVSIEAVDSKTRSARFNSEDFQLFIGGWNLDYPDIENPLVGLFNTDGGNNHYNCSDPVIDAKIEEGSRATTKEAHIKAFQEAETQIVTTLCGAIPYMQEGLPYLVNPKVGGVKPNGTIDAGGPGTWCGECYYVKKTS
jgi:oligopeptide transport system substrate-binding protein